MMRTVEGAPTSYDAGASLEMNQKFTVGTNIRVDETVSLYGLIKVVDKIKLGFAYDLATTDINSVNNSGSLELILKYQF